MAITTQQFEQLTEMGISLWQSRQSEVVIQSKTSRYSTQTEADLTKLHNDVLFNDILLSLGITIGEVSVKPDHLDAGIFNWYFNKSTHEQIANTVNSSAIDNSAIYSEQNSLFTPELTTIAQSAALKKQLWQTLTKHLL